MTADEIDKFIKENTWTFAKTMPHAPHWYLVKDKCNDTSAFEAFVVHIREHGCEASYSGHTYTYFDLAEFKYWTMGDPLPITVIINRAHRTPNAETLDNS